MLVWIVLQLWTLLDMCNGQPSLRSVFAERAQPVVPLQSLQSRTRTCTLQANADGSDDSANIIQAIKSCNHGGHVVFPEGQNFIIGTALDLTFLEHIDLDIQGNIQFTNDTDYWQANAFQQIYQNTTTFFQLGGEDVNVYGGGTIDGNGQVWWDLFRVDVVVQRPILFGTIGLVGGSISDLKLRACPYWCNFVANSSRVVFSNIDIDGMTNGTSADPADNTDGWDTYRSDNIVIQDSQINNGDDCVSFKPNSSNILVQNLYCNGSHGISVGSLGQYKDETDIVQNVHVYNTTLLNGSNGARIKLWPGAAADRQDRKGGGGSGFVRNVTWDTIYVSNVDRAIFITQCYNQNNNTLCDESPSKMTISDVTMRNFFGTTSPKYYQMETYLGLVGTIRCSGSMVSQCSNIVLEGMQVKSPHNDSDLMAVGLSQGLSIP